MDTREEIKGGNKIKCGICRKRDRIVKTCSGDILLPVGLPQLTRQRAGTRDKPLNNPIIDDTKAHRARCKRGGGLDRGDCRTDQSAAPGTGNQVPMPKVGIATKWLF